MRSSIWSTPFEALDVDSLWVSDRLVSPGVMLEPVTFLSYIAGRLRKMKLGTSTLVLPTRNPDRSGQRIGDLGFSFARSFVPGDRARRR